MTWLTSIVTRQLVCRATCQMGGEVQAIVSAWPLFNVFGSCHERVRVYWAQDDFVGGATLLGLSPHTLRVREAQTAAQANFIVAANPSVAETWQGHGFTPILIPFGVDVQAYENVDVLASAPDVDLPPPIAGFVGHINDRTDIALLEAVAAQGRSLLLVGPRDPAYEPTRWDALTKRPNVRWVGPKKFRDLPPYLRVIDVGLVPYGESAFNRGSFPLKTLEYLAAGRPVVATDLPATRWLATDLITIANEPAAFAEAVDYWLNKPRIKAAVDARRQFARQHSWARRAKEIVNLVCATGPTALCRSR